MACGNNMVSRSGLQSQPTALSHPAAAPGQSMAREQAAQAARQADRQVGQAQQAVKQAATTTALRSAVENAEQALNAARRGGGDSNAKSALRALERQVDQLRREAGRKQRDLEGREQYEREQHARAAAVALDHLAPMNLGVVPQVIHAEAGGKGAWSPELTTAAANAAVVVDNRAVFETDALGRTVRATTVLDQLAPTTDRSGTQQRAAGGADRLSTDDGGHIFATMFGGLGEGINIQAMDLSINRGAYLELEKLWAEQIAQGGQVHVEVTFHFDGDSRRPHQFEVTFDVGDGDTVTLPFYQ